MPRRNKKVPADAISEKPSESPGPRYLTLGINMAGLRCLVVGGGRVGARKVSTLVFAGAEVTVLAPAISDALQELSSAGRIHWQQGEYTPAALADFMLVVAATADPAVNLRIVSDAEERGILSCNVSAAGRSRVIFPALYAGGDVTVAVHSHGQSCRRSKDLRDEIARWLSAKKAATGGRGS